MTSSTPTPRPGRAQLEAKDPIPLLLALLLAAGLATQLLLPAPALDVPADAARAPDRSAAPPSFKAPPQVGMVDMAAILSRPLFNPARAVGDAAGPAASGDSLSLLGSATAGRRAVATIRDGAGAVHSLAPGQSLDGWTLEAVERGVVVLRRVGELRTLRVGQGPAASPPAAVPQ